MKLFLHALLFSLLLCTSVVALPTPQGLPLYHDPGLETHKRGRSSSPSPDPPPRAHPPRPARDGTPPYLTPGGHDGGHIRWNIPNGAIGFWKNRSNPPVSEILSFQLSCYAPHPCHTDGYIS